MAYGSPKPSTLGIETEPSTLGIEPLVGCLLNPRPGHHLSSTLLRRAARSLQPGRTGLRACGLTPSAALGIT